MTNVITYAIGDIHGRADLLEAVIEHSASDAAKISAAARFAFIGDVCDRGPRSRQAFEAVVETLAAYPGSFMIRGNHDEWFRRCLSGCEERVVAGWLSRGGMNTLESYLSGDSNGAAELIKTIHRDHIRLVDQASDIVLENGIAYTHAGVLPNKPLDRQDPHDLMWVRDPFLDHVGDLGAVVVHGHSVVGDLPVVTENRISIDTGAYKSGRLTVAAIDMARQQVRFHQTDGSAGRVVRVQPQLLDRGQGTALDESGFLMAQTPMRMAA